MGLPGNDDRDPTDFNQAARMARFDESIQIRHNRPTSSSFEMFPVETSSSACGRFDRMWESTKSRSLLTTTRESMAATLAISASDVQFPRGD